MTADLPNSYDEPRSSPVRNLAAALAPIEAVLRETAFGTRLTLTPIRAVEALTVIAADDVEGDVRTLLHDVVQQEWRGGDGIITVAGVADRLEIELVDAFNEDALVLDDLRIATLLELLPARQLRAVRVDGPIEPRDAAAMVAAAQHDRSPLEVELRATAALSVRADRMLTLDVRDEMTAYAVVAASLRRYVAAVLRKPVAEISAPPRSYFERLLGVSGRLSVRPIETDAFTTSVDVGISTAPRDEPRPAERSLIYDIFSRTWHDEE